MVDAEFECRPGEAVGPMDRKHEPEAIPVIHRDIKSCALQRCKRYWPKPKLPFGFAASQ
jgi:hypothetical protein